jgi:hypothetical protein
LATFVLVSFGFLIIVQNSGLPLFHILATFVLVSFGFSEHFAKQRLAVVLYGGDLCIDSS